MTYDVLQNWSPIRISPHLTFPFTHHHLLRPHCQFQPRLSRLDSATWPWMPLQGSMYSSSLLELRVSRPGEIGWRLCDRIYAPICRYMRSQKVISHIPRQGKYLRCDFIALFFTVRPPFSLRRSRCVPPSVPSTTSLPRTLR